MRYAIIFDIHGNLEALQSVLVHIKKRGIKEIICLGDIVGYGPNPIECTNIIMDTAQITLKGNHDEAVIEGPCLFNPIAKRAIEWTICTIQGTQNPRKQEIIELCKNI
ncbi:MAG TPA: metallophosphoesterase family protein [Planctomycetota bacterium]|nr:metallophosphoesterase family protein [Planctomycetota bacterium]